MDTMTIGQLINELKVEVAEGGTSRDTPIYACVPGTNTRIPITHIPVTNDGDAAIIEIGGPEIILYTH